MDEKINMNNNFLPLPPMAPPMYPNIGFQPQQILPPPMHINGKTIDGLQQQMQQNAANFPPVQQIRPTSVFILNEKAPIGPEAQKANCPNCNTTEKTRIVSRISLKTHFAAMLCCVTGLFCLVPIPYCMSAFKNKHHYCNNCGEYLGSCPAK